jgi:hypothetical protein
LKIYDFEFKIGDTIKYNKLEENRMKKLKLFTLFLAFLFVLTGCKNADTSLIAGKIKTNTILIKDNGQVQAAIVDNFDKDYYDKEELKNYIDTEIKVYNDLAGENTVKLNSFKIKYKVVNLILSYKNMEQYAKFNGVDAQLMTVEEAESKGLLPFTFINANNNETVYKKKILEKGKYKVIILNEKYDVKVVGNIKYYSNVNLSNYSKYKSYFCSREKNIHLHCKLLMYNLNVNKQAIIKVLF